MACRPLHQPKTSLAGGQRDWLEGRVSSGEGWSRNLDNFLSIIFSVEEEMFDSDLILLLPRTSLISYIYIILYIFFELQSHAPTLQHYALNYNPARPHTNVHDNSAFPALQEI